MDKTGAKNMDDLMAIPEDELIEIYTAPDEEGNCLNDLYNMPLRGEGSIIPEDPYQALKDGAAKDVIMMIGTNSDEWRYWVNEMGDVEMSEMDDDGIAENMAMYEEYEVFDELEEEFLEKEEEYTALVAGYVDEHLDLFVKIV